MPDRRTVLAALSLPALSFTSLGLSLSGQRSSTARAADPAQPDPAALEKEFAALMSHATLEGSYSTTGKDADPPKPDKYTLGEVRKLDGDTWLFEARVQYNNQDLKVPLTVRVLWAGDTPVITLTDMPIPGLGKFTSRVLVYGGEYAGTWSAGDHGGQMWGRVIRAKGEERGEERKEK